MTEGKWLSLNDKASRHGWQVEPTVEWEYSGLVPGDGYGRVADWALRSRMRRYEHIVCIRGTHSEGVILIGWIVEVDHQGVAPVDSDHVC